MAEDSSICYFVPVETYGKDISNFYTEEVQRLSEVLVDIPVKFEHFGGTSVPGSLTKGDIDIQIRVDKKYLPQIVNRMKNYAQVKRPEIWKEDLVLFKNEDKQFPVDYIVTVNGRDVEQCYFGVRDLLLRDKGLLKQYNDLKRSFEGKPYAGYREAKGKFWIEVFKSRMNLDFTKSSSGITN